ncbi:Polyketide cyclase / dehydrase and lipid transport [Asanoa ishikariensis]|uniref:Polyketide cyclase / dehydrase and lipid transport n=1 Tax=Asanoa ishikariensis TaxID=137265 RepID=A0A1H3TW90_9ACTN|nr:Polyketide cyclase / dehydrase and lipid transport [Asanoa ishikariensis]
MACRGYRDDVIVRTRWVVPHPPEALWPALCDSRLELRPACPVFYVGTPRPTQCRLPDGPGEVGAARQCVSEQGEVRQRITAWEPPARLAFRMESTNLGFHRFVDELGDVFELAPSGQGTSVTRTTTVTVRGFGRPALYPALWVGLKSVHRFVFRNWQKMSLPSGQRDDDRGLGG